MKTVRPLQTIFSVLLPTALLVSVASAHPGHDHGNIPSVLRHPFASLDHMVITGAVFVVAGGTILWTATRFAAMRRMRWVGAGLVTVGVALACV